MPEQARPPQINLSFCLLSVLLSQGNFFVFARMLHSPHLCMCVLLLCSYYTVDTPIVYPECTRSRVVIKRLIHLQEREATSETWQQLVEAVLVVVAI